MTTTFKMFDVQSVEIAAPFQKVFDFIAKPQHLPNWTNAFSAADDNSAMMVTPNGSLPIGLRTHADPKTGTIDWEMMMPDGTISTVYSRVTQLEGGNAVYTFVLPTPPVPIEALEGTLEQQKVILAKELANLAAILAK